MIQTEMVGERIRHYSDIGMHILQHPTEILYEDAVDYVPCAYTYTETDIPIDEPELTDSEALAILLGGDAE